MCNISSEFIHIAIIFFSMGCYKTLVFVLFINYLMVLVAIPMLNVRKTINKIGHHVNSPIYSYFHETMRGMSIVRAFNQ